MNMEDKKTKTEVRNVIQKDMKETEVQREEEAQYWRTRRLKVQ